MAFAYTIRKTGHAGGMRIVSGDYTSGGTTGGDIKTGLSTVFSVALTNKGSTANIYPPVCNETLPLNNVDGAVTIVTVTSTDGSFIICGE